MGARRERRTGFKLCQRKGKVCFLNKTRAKNSTKGFSLLRYCFGNEFSYTLRHIVAHRRALRCIRCCLLLKSRISSCYQLLFFFFYWFFQSTFKFCGVKLDSVFKPSELTLSQKTDKITQQILRRFHLCFKTIASMAF